MAGKYSAQNRDARAAGHAKNATPETISRSSLLRKRRQEKTDYETDEKFHGRVNIRVVPARHILKEDLLFNSLEIFRLFRLFRLFRNLYFFTKTGRP